MVRLIPEQPTFATTSEREVWERLRDGLGPDDVLLANLRLTDETKDHEADLVVLMPDVGILVLEVKGGSVLVRRGRAGGRRARGRSTRASTPSTRCARPSTRSATTSSSDPRWGNRNHVAWGHGVVTPYSEFADDFAVARAARGGRCTTATTRTTWRSGSATTPGACARPAAADVRRRRGDRRHPHRPAAHVVRRERRGRRAGRRGRPADPGAGDDPAGHPAAAPRSRCAAAPAAARPCSRSSRPRSSPAGGQGPQGAAGGAAVLLDRAGRVPQAPGRDLAPPGTGRRSSGRSTSSAGSGAPPTATGTDSEFWEERLPRLMAELADGPAGRQEVRLGRRRRGAGLRRRVVDAGAPRAARRGGGRALRLLRREPAHLRPLRPPAGAAGPAGARPQPPQHQADPRVLRAAGAEPDVRPRRRRARRPLRAAPAPTTRSRWPTTRSTRCSTRAGSRRNVALLTTGHRHPIQASAPTFHDQDGYWRTFWERRRLLRPRPRLQGTRAARRRAVPQRGRRARDRARERLYVGMSRATDVLVVVGRPGSDPAGRRRRRGAAARRAGDRDGRWEPTAMGLRLLRETGRCLPARSSTACSARPAVSRCSRRRGTERQQPARRPGQRSRVATAARNMPCDHSSGWALGPHRSSHSSSTSGCQQRRDLLREQQVVVGGGDDPVEELRRPVGARRAWCQASSAASTGHWPPP